MKTYYTIALLALAALTAACGQIKTKPRPDAGPDAGAPAPAPTPAAVTYDTPKTRKQGESITATYVGSSNVGKSAIVAFAVDNPGDDEQPVSSLLMFQATTPDGATGKLDLLKSKCDGNVPPHGRLQCILKYDFLDAPGELRVRADGAWFRIQPRDAGTP